MQLLIIGAYQPDVQWLTVHLRPLLPDDALTALDAPGLSAWLANNPSFNARVLLCGLDVAPQHQELAQADADLRAALSQAGSSFGVVYGQGLQRLLNAQRLVQPRDLPIHPKRAVWSCEACSDPDCELKLFTGLKDLKAADLPAP